MHKSPFSSAPSADAFSINSDNVHCYFSTVQSEVHPQELVDSALARRHARAVELHRRRKGRPARAAGVVVVMLLLAGACLTGWVWLVP